MAEIYLPCVHWQVDKPRRPEIYGTVWYRVPQHKETQASQPPRSRFFFAGLVYSVRVFVELGLRSIGESVCSARKIAHDGDGDGARSSINASQPASHSLYDSSQVQGLLDNAISFM